MATSRTRERGTTEATSVRTVSKFLGEVPKTETKTDYSSYTGTFAEISDTPHPNYVRRINRGEIIMGDVLNVVTTRGVTNGYLHIQDYENRPNYEATLTGDFAGFAERQTSVKSTAWAAELNSMRDIALVKAYAKIRDESVMSGEIMPEIGRSLKMLYNPFGSTRKLLQRCWKDAAKSYRKSAKSIAHANASAWLEYRYGMTPLFLDIGTALSMYSQGETRLRKARKVARASEVRSYKDRSDFSDVMSYYVNSYRITGSVEQSVNYSAHGGVLFQIENRTQAQSLAEDLRLGADSMASTAWELTPFSFVYDWFQLVGPWLEAINLPPSVTVLGNWVTTTTDVTKTTTVSQVRWFSDPGQHWYAGNGGGSVIHERTYHRSVGQTLPSYPPTTLRLPGVLHATDALALMMSPILGLLSKLRH